MICLEPATICEFLRVTRVRTISQQVYERYDEDDEDLATASALGNLNLELDGTVTPEWTSPVTAIEGIACSTFTSMAPFPSMDTPGPTHSEDVRPALRYHDAETQTMERTLDVLAPPDQCRAWMDLAWVPRHVLRRERGAARARAVHRETQTDTADGLRAPDPWDEDAYEDPFLWSYYDCGDDEYGESCDNAYKHWYGDDFDDDIYVDDFDI